MENKFVNRKLEKRGVVSPCHERLWSHEGKVKRHPVTSATVARVRRIDDERASPDSHVGR
jgi:hypothetical protein